MNRSDGLYYFILIVHVLCAIVALGPNFVATGMRKIEGTGQTLSDFAKFVQLPAMFGMLVTGLGLLTAWEGNDGKSAFALPWVSMAFTILIVMAVLTFLLARAYASGDAKKVPMFTGILHLLVVAALVVMVLGPAGKLG